MKKALFFLTTIFFYSQILASHISGVEVSMRTLDSLKYEIHFSLYRECGAIAMEPWDVNLRSLDSGDIFSMGVMAIQTLKVTDITPVCATKRSCNTSPNTPFSWKGLEKHQYTMVLDLTSDSLRHFVEKNTCWLRVEVSQNARNAKITTGPSGTVYSFLDINICKAPINSSPKFNQEPISMLCCSQPATISLGGSDYVEGDSLSYSFGSPMSAFNNNNQFTKNYFYNKPFQVYYPGSTSFPYHNTKANPPIGIYLNPISGDLTFTPTKCDEVTVAVVEVKEWRMIKGKYEHISTSRRDMQYEISQCPVNNPPSISGSSEQTIFLNQCDSTFSFDVSVKDVRVANQLHIDSIDVFLEHAPKGSSIEVLFKTAGITNVRVNWNPKLTELKDVETVFFGLKAEDDACPYRSITGKTFVVHVVKDSTKGKVKFSVFEDPNKDCIREKQDSSIVNRTILGFKSNATGPFVMYRTDSLKSEGSCLDAGSYQTKLMPHPFYNDVCNDSMLQVKPLTSHQINFGSNLLRGVVKGQVLADFNVNCKIDSREDGISGIKVIAQPGNYFTTTNKQGRYVLSLPEGKYTIAIEDSLFTESCHITHDISMKVDSVFTEEFYLNRDSGNVSISVDEGRGVEKNKNSQISLTIKNFGKDAIPSNGMVLHHSPLLKITETSTNQIINDSTVIYHKLLEPYSYYTEHVDFQLKDTTSVLGDSFYFSTHLISELPDTLDHIRKDNKEDGYVRVIKTKVPNRKFTDLSNLITPLDSVLEYTIHFQNTSQDVVYYAEVRDTLPDLLDHSSIEFISASHEGLDFIVQDGILFCIFSNINLTQQDIYEKNSNGFVKFRIKQKRGIVDESEIINGASVYFNLDDPIRLNGHRNTVISPFELDTIGTHYCAKDSITVLYKVNYKQETKELLSLQLSDNTGSFTHPATIKQWVDSTSLGRVTAQLPSTEGKYFKLRIIGGHPLAKTFEESYSNEFEIENLGASSISISQKVICVGDSIDVTVDDNSSNEYFLMTRDGLLRHNQTGVFNHVTFKTDAELYVISNSGARCITVSDTALVVVKSAPTIKFDLDTVICENTTFKVVNEFQGNTEIQDYLILRGGGSDQIRQNEITELNHHYQEKGIYIFTIQANATNGCQSLFEQSIYVSKKVEADFEFANPEQCLNQNSFKAFNFDDGGVFPVVHSWDNGEGGLSSTGAFTQTYSTAGIYDVQHITSVAGECPDTFNQTITVLESPHTSFNADDVCLEEVIKLTNTSTSNSNIDSEIILVDEVMIHQESSSKSDFEINLDAVGSYSISMEQLIGNCGDTFTHSVTVFDLPVVGLESELLNEDLSIVGIENKSSNSESSHYKFGDGVEENRTDLVFEYEYPKPGIYQLVLTETSQQGCVNIDTFKIDALGNISFLIPNAITPDNDGLNDKFQIVDPDLVAEIEFSLYDQRNHLVVRSNDPYNLINKEVNQGTYAYIMVLKDIKGVEHKYEGVLLILK